MHRGWVCYKTLYLGKDTSIKAYVSISLPLNFPLLNPNLPNHPPNHYCSRSAPHSTPQYHPPTHIQHRMLYHPDWLRPRRFQLDPPPPVHLSDHLQASNHLTTTPGKALIDSCASSEPTVSKDRPSLRKILTNQLAVVGMQIPLGLQCRWDG